MKNRIELFTILIIQFHNHNIHHVLHFLLIIILMNMYIMINKKLKNKKLFLMKIYSKKYFIIFIKSYIKQHTVSYTNSIRNKYTI